MTILSKVSLRHLAIASWMFGSFLLGCGGRAAPSDNDQTGFDDAGSVTDGSSWFDSDDAVEFPDAATGCLGLPGPMMTPITRGDGSVYCIDSTPVTNRQFNEWVRSGPDWSHRPSECTRQKDNNLGDDNERPANGVSFCEAKAYCGWAGKQLCGAFDGDSLDAEGADDPQRNAWLYACTGGGRQDYPYGDSYEEGRCVDSSWLEGAPWNAEPVPVRSAPGCEGGFPGLFDMVGNVMEWIDAVDGDRRGLAGGTILAAHFDAICTSLEWGHIESAGMTIGFRCCKLDL